MGNFFDFFTEGHKENEVMVGFWRWSVNFEFDLVEFARRRRRHALYVGLYLTSAHIRKIALIR